MCACPRVLRIPDARNPGDPGRFLAPACLPNEAPLPDRSQAKTCSLRKMPSHLEGRLVNRLRVRSKRNRGASALQVRWRRAARPHILRAASEMPSAIEEVAMATLLPFRALRPPPSLAGPGRCAPVRRRLDARSACAGRRKRGQLPPRLPARRLTWPRGWTSTPSRSTAGPGGARRRFRRAASSGPTPSPASTSTRSGWGATRQTGLVACASVDEYDRDLIKKHEKTRADKEDDRVRHIDALGGPRRAGLPHLPRQRRRSTRPSRR